MKILINAYNLRIGGGESVGVGIINSIYSLNTDNQYIILTNKGKSYSKFASTDRIIIKHVPDFFTHNILGNILSTFYLMYMSYLIDPDTIFSMGNYAVPSKKKQLVLLHWPYIVYPDSTIWQQMSYFSRLKRKIRALVVRQKLSFATALTVQTPLMKERVLKHLDFKGEVHVVESATALDIKASDSKSNDAIYKMKQAREQYPSYKFLLFVSVYYNHKNHEVLIPLAKEIKHNKKQIKLFISLDAQQNKKVKVLLDIIKKEHLEDTIVNLGHIPRSQLSSIYKCSDAFLMPTLLESYGMTYMEAMISGIPIFTSDLDFAHEACGEAAFYFDPLDYKSIYTSFIQAYENPKLIQQKIELGKQKAAVFLTWEEVTLKYLHILKNL